MKSKRLTLAPATLATLVTATLSLGSTAQAEDYVDPQAEDNAAFDIAQCVAPVDSSERAIYCAKLHGNDNGVPQDAMNFSAERSDGTWTIVQTDVETDDAQWLIELNDAGELLSITSL
jgi:hypothetical protein